MIYGFVRLPIHASLLIGVIGGCFALPESRMTNLPDPAIRTFVYLVLGNALGVISARSIEIRERQLFLQKQTLQEAQAELRIRGEIAEQASASKTRLVAAVGHDLRQPMMAARLHLSVLTQRIQAGDGDAANLQADRVQQSIQLLSDMLEHLLLAARLDSGTERVVIQEVALRDVFDRVAHLCEPMAQEQGAALIIRMPRSDVHVLTDSRIFLRALVNLVTNALKFIKPPEQDELSRVVVRAALIGKVCKIAVLDNGIGIAEHDKEAIWEPFFQVGNEERNRAQGIGLGLYLVSQSLRALEGHQICVGSRLGSGTCFTLRLPGASIKVAHSIPVSLSGASNPAYFPSLKGMHVLLIEDDQGAREALEAQLDAWGVSYCSGPSSDDVLTAVLTADRNVDMILADLRLPGELDGISTIRLIRKRLGYAADAVVITGEVDRAAVWDRLPERCSLIQKPFDSTLLYRVLATGRSLEI
jgi:signal transduction histidine kinase/CheY-like chemotaxis protein